MTNLINVLVAGFIAQVDHIFDDQTFWECRMHKDYRQNGPCHSIGKCLSFVYWQIFIFVFILIQFDKSGDSFEHFFTAVSANILSSIENETKFSDICKTEFVYNWRLLHTCFSFDGHHLLKYQREIVQLLKRIYEIDFEDNFKHNNMITDILSFLFYVLTSIYLTGYSFDQKKSPTDDGDSGDGRDLFDRLMVSFW